MSGISGEQKQGGPTLNILSARSSSSSCKFYVTYSSSFVNILFVLMIIASVNSLEECQWSSGRRLVNHQKLPTRRLLTRRKLGDRFSVIGSGCTASGNCFKSLNYPSNYGSEESCFITVQNTGTLSSVAFDTYSSSDYLEIGEKKYSGTNGPTNVAVSENDVIKWRSDSWGQKSGFEVCFTLTFSCSITDGSTVNNKDCVCGTSECDSTTGLVCTVSTNTCSHPAVCSVIDSSSLNTEACACGSTDCDSSTGLMCTASENICSHPAACSIIDGSSINTKDCECGSNVCDSSTGLFCLASTNQCNTKRMCSSIYGKTINSENCACGSSDCDSSSGLFCLNLKNQCDTKHFVTYHSVPSSGCKLSHPVEVMGTMFVSGNSTVTCEDTVGWKSDVSDSTCSDYKTKGKRFFTDYYYFFLTDTF